MMMKRENAFIDLFSNSLNKFFKEMYMEISLKNLLCLDAGA